jgi:hypothetical protein
MTAQPACVIADAGLGAANVHPLSHLIRLSGGEVVQLSVEDGRHDVVTISAW